MASEPHDLHMRISTSPAYGLPATQRCLRLTAGAATPGEAEGGGKGGAIRGPGRGLVLTKEVNDGHRNDC